jgi:hypothetical protein
MITLEVKFRNIKLNKEEQNLATGAHTREVLRGKFQNALGSKPSFATFTQLLLDESVLRRMISKYSEQLIYQPLNEIRFWFEYSSGVFLEPGYPPLFYAKNRGKSVSPNKSAAAAIGEGIAGLLAKRLYQCRKLARPNHDYPDIVMDAGNKTYLIESKATIDTSEAHIRSTLDEEIFRLASFTATCAQLDVRPVGALLVGTLVASEAVYRSFVSEITLI